MKNNIELGLRDKMDKKTQVRTLVLDQDNDIWTKAHLALYIMDSMCNGDDVWLSMLNNANMALNKKEFDRFDFILDRMKKAVGWDEKDDVFIANNKR